MSASALIVAAGKGSRFASETAKQYHAIAGRSVLEQTTQKIAHAYTWQQVVVILPSNTTKQALDDWQQRLQALHPSTRIQTVLGGSTRAHSVQCGLEALITSVEKTLIHDGVRPLVSREEVLQTLALCELPYSGAVSALPVRDTLKKVSADGMIESTVSRQDVWAMLTPQVFLTQDLIKAYQAYFKADHPQATDDAQVMEAAGYMVRVVQGNPQNIKITYPEDLAWVAAQWKENV